MVITLSLSLAQARVKTAGRITVADEAKRTLEDLQVSAASLENEADQLRMIVANPQLSPESHSHILMAMREEINRMGREIYNLDADREALPLWEQQAVNKALPLLKDTAANTENAIEYFNDNKDHLWAEAYRGYADRLWQDSEQMAKTLTNYLKLAKLQGQEQHLEDSIGPVSGN
jgi:hypothetical protein